MTAPLAGTVLIVDDDPIIVQTFSTILGRFPGLRTLTAGDAAQALDAARVHRPDLILSDLSMPDMSGAELAAQVRRDQELEGTLFVIVTGIQDAHQALETQPGIDDIMTKPVTAPELVAKVRAMLRLKRVYDELRADKLELERLHAAIENRFDQILSLLVQIIDLSVPGSALRAAETARLAERLAERFDVPEVLHRDLHLAARLHELGKLILRREPGDGDGPEDVIEGDQWRYAVAAKEVLAKTEGLEGAAELVGAIFENWDGTGHPDRLRQGQIPLRSRFLRILIDYQLLLGRKGVDQSEAALESLRHHAGTRYDPLAVAYFEAIVRDTDPDQWRERRMRVPTADLEVGMVLADDLCTSSGMKLLARGATITATSLETILRRHRSDPIVHGAWIERASTG